MGGGKDKSSRSTSRFAYGGEKPIDWVCGFFDNGVCVCGYVRLWIDGVMVKCILFLLLCESCESYGLLS